MLPAADAHRASPDAETYDVIVIGAGIAGTSAANALSLAGHSVALIDNRPTLPPMFRAEKIGDQQMAFLDRFGLGTAAREIMTTFKGVWLHRYGHVVERQVKREYSASYADLVNGLRAALSPQVDFIIDIASEVQTSATWQTVELRGGRRLVGRLLVVATGMGEAFGRRLGISRGMQRKGHSLAAGFNLSRPPADFPFPSLVWLGDGPSDRMAYFTIFPIGDRMRANLFVYRTIGESWTKTLRQHPYDTLHDLMPGFEAAFGRLEGDEHIDVFPIDLTVAEGHRQPGMVLLGDAFCTTCPVTGTGLHKALNDVDRLHAHVGDWLATPGMSADKVAQFYDDPIKRKVDGDSLNFARTERELQVNDSLFWRIRRLRRTLIRRNHYGFTGFMKQRPGAALMVSSLLLDQPMRRSHEG